MAKLIDADALNKILMDFVRRYRKGRFNLIAEGLEDARKVLYAMPTIEAEPVRHGRWDLYGNDDDIGCSYWCSECHKSYNEDWFYTHGEYTPFKRCPNCGAKMDKDKE